MIEDKQYNKDLEDSKTIVRAVMLGKESLYWQVIEKEIDQRMKYFQNFILDFSKKGIRSKKDRELFNRAVDNIDNMRWLKGINEILVKKHTGIIEKFTNILENGFKKVESFVR